MVCIKNISTEREAASAQGAAELSSRRVRDAGQSVYMALAQRASVISL